MARKPRPKTVEGEAFDEEVPDRTVVDQDAFEALRKEWEESDDA